MSTRYIHRSPLICLYKTIQQRDKNNYLTETENEINTLWKTKSLYKTIKKHQKYLKIDNLMDIIKSADDKDKLDKHISKIAFMNIIFNY